MPVFIANRQWVAVLLAVFMAFALSACGGGSSTRTAAPDPGAHAHAAHSGGDRSAADQCADGHQCGYRGPLRVSQGRPATRTLPTWRPW